MSQLPEELDVRLIELETRAAYQEDTILKLQTLIRAQQQQMYHLETRFETLMDRFRSVLERDSSPIPNEKPPHY